MKTRLYLIRHGQTELNAQRRYCGFIDAGLNQEGRRQAVLLGARLKTERYDRIVSSDLSRAVQTARLALGPGALIEQMPGLREINFGVFEGLSHDEILERFPCDYRSWLDDPFRAAIPRGESLAAFGMRVNEALGEIVSASGGKAVAVVTHGGVISVYINSLRQTRDFWKTIPHSASVSIVESDGAHAGECVVFDDTSHLQAQEES